MILSLEQINYFIKCASNGTLLYINGINYLGQEFKTIAKVMTSDKPSRDDYYVDIDSIAFFLGQRNKNTGEKLYIVMHTCLEGEAGEYRSLYIGQIKDARGKVVYENPSYEEIVQIVKQNAKSVYGRSSRLTSLEKRTLAIIGQPITIDGIQGVIRAVNRAEAIVGTVPCADCSNGKSDFVRRILPHGVEVDSKSIHRLVTGKEDLSEM